MKRSFKVQNKSSAKRRNIFLKLFKLSVKVKVKTQCKDDFILLCAGDKKIHWIQKIIQQVFFSFLWSAFVRLIKILKHVS